MVLYFRLLFTSYGLRIVKNAGILLESTRRWLLSLSISEKLTVHLKLCLYW